MLRNTLTTQPTTTDFSQITNIVLLSPTDTPPTPPLTSHLYIKYDGKSENYTIYLQQLVDEEKGQSFQVSFSIPRDCVPSQIREKFTSQTTTISAGDYHNNPLSELSEKIDSFLRGKQAEIPEEKFEAAARPGKCYKAVTASVIGLLGFICGAVAAEVMESSVAKEFDENHDFPFYVVVGVPVGVIAVGIYLCCADKIPTCSMSSISSSMLSIRGLFGRGKATIEPVALDGQTPNQDAALISRGCANA